MFENLMAQSLLFNAGLASKEELLHEIDSEFIGTPDSDILFDLEWCFSDVNKIISTIRRYAEEFKIDYDVLGRVLIIKLSTIYSNGGIGIHEFGSKVYSIWSLLPESIKLVEPFWTMSYADDPLSWGEEKQTRNLYEKMFKFYNV